MHTTFNKDLDLYVVVIIPYKGYLIQDDGYKLNYTIYKGDCAVYQAKSVQESISYLSEAI